MRLATVFTLLGAVLAAATPSRADNVLAGHDLFTTQPGSTHEFQGPYEIPAGFFDPGSEPFTGTIQLQGVPVGYAPCPGSDPTDTIMRRMADAVFPGGEMIPIEIIALSLVSVEPITVTYPAAPPEEWDVAIRLAAPQPGSMVIQHDQPGGGTFTSQFQVQPLLVFTRRSDLEMRQLEPVPQPFQFGTTGSPWSHTPEAGMLDIPGCTTNFFPGVMPPGPNMPAGLPPFSITLTGPHTSLELRWTTPSPTAARSSTWGRVKTLYR